MKEKYTLVTQSFGRESEYRRVTLTILSFYAYTSDPSVPTLLFTDRPDWFAPFLAELPVSYVELTPEKIKTMRGNIDFLHRMKIALIEEAFQVSGGSLLYTDSDTFFTADPQALMQTLDEGRSYMHLHEYPFEYLRDMPMPAGTTFRAFLELIESREFQLSNGKSLKVTAQHSSWNAGVMLLHKSHAALIPDVYALTEQFYPGTKNHASEQYAFSILLQETTRLQACDQVICHYWYNIRKKIADELLPARLEALKSLPVAQKLSEIKEWVKALPGIFEEHVHSLKDNAIQTLNENKFKEGYKWAFRAFRSGALSDSTFIKDVLYHFKRQLKGDKR